MNRRRLLTLALLLTLFAGLLYLGLRETPRPVDTEPVVRAPLSETIEEEGVSHMAARHTLTAPFAAVVERHALDPGRSVERGAPLLTLQPLAAPPLDPVARSEAEGRQQVAAMRLAAAREEQAAAAAAADEARREQQRLEALAERDHVSRQALEQARLHSRLLEARRRAADFSLRAAEYERATAEAVLQRATGERPDGAPHTLHAPADGVILRHAGHSERLVERGHELLELADPLSLEVRVDVLTRDAVRLEPGQAVIIEGWGGDEALNGRVARIEPAAFTRVSALGVDEQRTWVVVQPEPPEAAWQRLGDGFRVDARFILWHDEAVLQIPTSALFRHGDGWAVFVVEAERARLRPVERGRRGRHATAIVAGLEAGERVIIHPDRALQDGSRITPR